MSAIGRLVGIVAMVLALLGGSAARAEEPAPPWQQTITGQVEAMRAHDAGKALSFASELFQTSFPDPRTFLAAIEQWGYAPIMDSRSHTFGPYQRLGEASVMQQVKFVGKDQRLYDAIYQLTEEPSGWRVVGVQLMAPNAIGV